MQPDPRRGGWYRCDRRADRALGAERINNVRRQVDGNRQEVRNVGGLRAFAVDELALRAVAMLLRRGMLILGIP